MTLEYKVIEDKVSIEGQSFITYGISYNDITIHDISIRKDKIVKLINKCNDYKLEPIHIYDVIEDFLAE